MTNYGVHSEVGTLRKVIVHRPELSLKRLTPTTTMNCSSTMFSGSNKPNESTTRSWR